MFHVETIGDGSLNPVYHRQIQLKEDDNELKKGVTSRMLTSKFDERVRREMEYSSRGDVIRSGMCFKEKREDYNRDIYIYI